MKIHIRPFAKSDRFFVIASSAGGTQVHITLDENRTPAKVKHLRLFHCTKADEFTDFRVTPDDELRYIPVLGSGVYMTGSRAIVRMYRSFMQRSQARIVEAKVTDSSALRIYPLERSEYEAFRGAAHKKLPAYGRALKDALLRGGWHGACFFIERDAMYEMVMYSPSHISIVDQDVVLESIPNLQAA